MAQPFSETVSGAVNTTWGPTHESASESFYSISDAMPQQFQRAFGQGTGTWNEVSKGFLTGRERRGALFGDYLYQQPMLYSDQGPAARAGAVGPEIPAHLGRLDPGTSTDSAAPPVAQLLRAFQQQGGNIGRGF